MTSLYRYSIRHPKTVMAVALLVTAAVAPGAARLRLRTDGNALLPPDAPEIKLDHAIRDEFGVRDQVIVVIRSADPTGIYNLHTLGLVMDWTRRFGEIDGLKPEDIISLATEKTDRVFQGTLRNRGFLDPPPQTPADLAQIRDDLRRIKLYTGTIVSYDGSAAAIVIGVPAGLDRPKLHRTLMGIIAESGPISEKVHVVGAPVAESLFGTHILEDLGVPMALLGDHIPRGEEEAWCEKGLSHQQPWQMPRSVYELRLFIGRHIGLVPIAIVVMALIFFLSFRDFAAVWLPLLEVGACLAFVFGLMGWLDVPVYLTITVMPVILITMGVTDEVHIFTHYQLLARQTGGADRMAIVGQAMDEVWRPVLRTGLTTAIGFLSFAIAPIKPVQAFGVFTAIGILFCMFWSLTVVPACLRLIRPRRSRSRSVGPPWPTWKAGRSALLGDDGGLRANRPPAVSHATPLNVASGSVSHATPLNVASGSVSHATRLSVVGAAGDGFWGGLARFIVRRRGLILLGGAAVIVFGVIGARKLFVQDSWIEGFAPDSEFRRATDLVNQQFYGTHLLLVCVDAGDDVVSGEVLSANVGMFDARLPVAAEVKPESLVGRWLRITPPPNPALDSKLGSLHRRPPRLARIVKAVRDGDFLNVTTEQEDGTLKPLPYAGPQEVLEYDIRPRRFMSPDTFRLVEGLESFIAQHRADAVGGVLGPADYLATTNYMVGGRKEERRRIPDGAGGIRSLWGHYERVRGPQRMRELLNPAQSRGLITVFMGGANFVSTRHLMDDIRDYERTHLAPHGISLSFAGDVAVSQSLIDAVVTTQVGSLATSVLGDLIVIVLLSRSIGLGLYCIIPCSIAILLNFAVMGVVGMPLGVATSMFSAMTMGIGVDYAIHLAAGIRLGTERGLPLPQALVAAFKTTGRANVLDAVAIGFAFGIMVLSQVPSNARLGGLVFLSMFNCVIMSLLLLPAMLTVWQPRPLRTACGIIPSDGGLASQAAGPARTGL